MTRRLWVNQVSAVDCRPLEVGRRWYVLGGEQRRYELKEEDYFTRMRISETSESEKEVRKEEVQV